MSLLSVFNWRLTIREGLLANPALKGRELKEYYFDSDFWLKQGDLKQAKDSKLNSLIADLKDGDFLVVSDDEASTVVLPQVPSTIPTLVIGINDFSTSPAWDQFCSAVKKHAVLFEDYPYKKALELAQKRFPSVSRITAIGGDTPTSKSIISGLRQFISTTKLTLVETAASRDWTTWRTKLQSWDNPNTLTWVFVPYGVRDSLNEEISPHAMLEWINSHVHNSRAGAYALKGGLDVTIGLDPKEFGAEAGSLAEAMLSNKTLKCRNPSRSYRVALGKRKVSK